jgi:hypothetical protein
MSNHTHIRDEQFWYTTAAAGFNTFIIGKETSILPSCLLILASFVVSLLGIHLILTRWVKVAVDDGRIAAPPFDNKTATASQRLQYSLWEIRAYFRDFGYVLAELSGSLFYLLLIVLTLVGVLVRCLSCKPYA